MPRAVASLESHLGYWLRAVSNQVSGAFAARVETLGVSVAEWVVLRPCSTRRASRRANSPTRPA
jgi:hypothetical protein